MEFQLFGEYIFYGDCHQPSTLDNNFLLNFRQKLGYLASGAEELWELKRQACFVFYKTDTWRFSPAVICNCRTCKVTATLVIVLVLSSLGQRPDTNNLEEEKNFFDS